jgi:hypothetical protein
MKTALMIASFQSVLLCAGLSFAGDDVSVDQLPPPVRATVERETQGGRITELERDQEQGQTIYEVEFSLDGKKYELDVAADGTLLERRLD